MTEIYLNGGKSVSVENSYEEVVNFIIYEVDHKEQFIEVDECYVYFDDSKTKMVKGTRKIYVQISNILYVQ